MADDVENIEDDDDDDDDEQAQQSRKKIGKKTGTSLTNANAFKRSDQS